MHAFVATSRSTLRGPLRSLHKPLDTCVVRCLSSAALRSNPYPFPSSQNPTPYQIFHLTSHASPADIKRRYYELVKLYHPDSALSRSIEPDPVIRHTQFSAITRAYARLKKGPAGVEHLGLDAMPDDTGKGNSGFNPWRRAPHTYQRPFVEDRFIDERWKDGIIWGIMAFSVIMVTAQALSIRQNRDPQAFGKYVASVGLQSGRTTQSTNNTTDEDSERLRKKS